MLIDSDLEDLNEGNSLIDSKEQSLSSENVNIEEEEPNINVNNLEEPYINYDFNDTSKSNTNFPRHLNKKSFLPQSLLTHRNSMQSTIDKHLIPMSNSKKPLWIEDVKKTCEKFIPQVDMKDLENTKDILIKEEQEEIFLNLEDYPYFQTVKKLMYAFGDIYKNNSRTVLYMHDFLKRLLIVLAKILNECEFKKILEHLYSYEYHKFFNYKKLKFKNNFELAADDYEGEENINNILDRNCDNSLDLQDNNDLVDVNVRNKNLNNEKLKKKHLNTHSYSAFDLGDPIEIEEIVDISEKGNRLESNSGSNYEKPVESQKNYLENIFEEKDENYFENLEFQDQRTSNMNHTEYLEFISCRHQTFLTKGKKTFLNFLQNILQNYFVFELRDSNNIELISFLMKEILRKVITQSIKNKFPGSEKKLYILNYPLTVEDVEEFCNKEIEKLESFLDDFYTDIYLIKEFKKKKFSKKNNKNVKIKRNRDEFVIVIKKLIYLDDEKQIEFLRREKKNSEEKVLDLQKKLCENYNLIKKKLKEIIEDKTGLKPASKTRAKSKKSIKIDTNCSNSSDNLFKEYKSIFNIDLKLTNFYEYFLIKDYLIENLEKRIQILLEYNKNNNSSANTNLANHPDYKNLTDELNKKSNILRKLSRKTLSAEFSQWLKLTSLERNYLIEQYKDIYNTYDKKNHNDDKNCNHNERNTKNLDNFSCESE